MAIDHKSQSDKVKSSMPGHTISYYSGGADRNETTPHPQSSDQDSLHQGVIPENMPTIEKNPEKNFYINSRNT